MKAISMSRACLEATVLGVAASLGTWMVFFATQPPASAAADAMVRPEGRPDGLQVALVAGGCLGHGALLLGAFLGARLLLSGERRPLLIGATALDLTMLAWIPVVACAGWMALG